jgi:hypothetical protein
MDASRDIKRMFVFVFKKKLKFYFILFFKLIFFNVFILF